MTPSPSKPHPALSIGLPLLVLLTCTTIVLWPGFAMHADRLSTAITLDLTVTAPLLYWLAIRRSTVPSSTIVRVFVLGLLAAGLLLRSVPHPFLHLLKIWVSPLAEGWIIFVLVRRLYALQRDRKGNAPGGDVLSRGREILGQILGSRRMGDIVMSELAVFYYVFKASSKTIDDRTSFSYHKGNSIRLVLGTLLGCFVAETLGVHFLIALFNHTAAWILTGLGGYTMLQLYAHMRAIGARPILIDDGILYLRNGLAADLALRIDQIAAAERLPLRSHRAAGAEMPGPADQDAAAGSPNSRGLRYSAGSPVGQKLPGRTGAGEARLGLLGSLENPNIMIRLKRPVIVYRPFGIRKEAGTIFFFVDRPEEFLKAVALAEKR